MFRNYFVTALRNLASHKLYSFINIAGLAVGLACAIFVLMFIRDEISYDKWVPGTENLYRVEKTYRMPGQEALQIATVPFPLPLAMKAEIPEVRATTRLNYTYMTLFVGNRQFREHVGAVDPNFLTVVRLPLLRGDPANTFHDPESVVLSESAARKYFGTTEAIGKIIQTTANCELNSDQEACRNKLVPLKVTGILRDIPRNSQLDGDMFIPNTSIVDRMDQRAKQSWFLSTTFGYVLLAPGVSTRTVTTKMAPVFDRTVTGELHAEGLRFRGGQIYSIDLTPFTDVHLTGDRWHGNETPSGSWPTLYGAGIVGVVILFIACFNFTNLATAIASLRAREIAMRKTVGARRRQLIVQFLSEAVLTALLSLTIAMALVEILRPAFRRLLGHSVVFHYGATWLTLLLIIAVAAGLMSGIYPALVLSDFQPSRMLRNSGSGRTVSGGLQSALVVLQFAVSIGLGIAVIVVFSQIHFARNIDLGFRRDNILVISGNGLVTLSGRESFVQRLRSNPGILDLALTAALPFDRSVRISSAQRAGHPETVQLHERIIGTNAVPLLGMRLVAGRLLSDRRAQDQLDTKDPKEGVNEGRNILLDEAAAVRLGFTPQQAIGQTIKLFGGHVHVVGILANAKFDGAREPVKPSAYAYDPQASAAIIARLRPDSMRQTLAFIDRAWHDFAPTKIVQRWLLDEDFGRLYQSDERQGGLFGVFVAIAISFACLGLFGLAAFTAGQRTREIGIRKVFGARTRDLVVLLLWQFSIPVLLANLIAWPVAWYYLHNWLQGFAYRITLSPLYFAAAGLAALVIAWTTILAHALRVARTNPIHALRTE